MFRVIRWFFITLVTIALALSLAFGFKYLQNKYCPAYQFNDFAVSNFSGNTGSLKEAVQSGALLLEDKKYSLFLKSYIPEVGKARFIKDGMMVEEFVNSFKGGKAGEMLEVLMGCAEQDYEMSNNGNQGVCHLKEKTVGKNKMTFVRENGSWRIED